MCCEYRRIMHLGHAKLHVFRGRGLIKCKPRTRGFYDSAVAPTDEKPQKYAKYTWKNVSYIF